MPTIHRVSLDRQDEAPHGVCIYVGCPGSGKTTLAARHLSAWERSGTPAAVLDPARTTPLARFARANSLKSWANAVWKTKQSAAYTPADPPAEAIEIGKAVYQGGRCLLLIDELRAFVPVSRPVPTAMMTAFRLWRWSRVPYLGVTTQSVGDLGRHLKSVLNCWYIFRLTDYEDQAEVARNTGVPRELIARLPQGMALRVTTGF